MILDESSEDGFVEIKGSALEFMAQLNDRLALVDKLMSVLPPANKE